MARKRIIDPKAQAGDESKSPATPSSSASAASHLRPRRLGDYIGQQSLVEKISITLEAVKGRGEPMEHVLLHGPPGLGKTTLAHVIAQEMGTNSYATSGPALTKAGDLIGTLTRLRAGDVLFIDEIHRLPPTVEEYIYPAMEDFRIDITVDGGRHARVVAIDLQPFTLIGATTRAGLLSGALRNRFGIAHHLQFYGRDELVEILRRAISLLGIEDIPASAMQVIAARSRGTPRVALRLLRRVRDFAHVRAGGRIDDRAVDDALRLEGVDDRGLDNLDRSYMRTLAETYEGGPVGLEAIAATLGEDAGTLEDVVEPFLLQIGFLARTRQGRRLTRAGAAHLGIREAGARFRGDRGQPDLFEPKPVPDLPARPGRRDDPL